MIWSARNSYTTKASLVLAILALCPESLFGVIMAPTQSHLQCLVPLLVRIFMVPIFGMGVLGDYSTWSFLLWLIAVGLCLCELAFLTAFDSKFISCRYKNYFARWALLLLLTFIQFLIAIIWMYASPFEPLINYPSDFG